MIEVTSASLLARPTNTGHSQFGTVGTVVIIAIVCIVVAVGLFIKRRR